MSKKVTRLVEKSHKYGDDRNELAIKHRKAGKGFSRSKDIHEDRGRRQSKFGGRRVASV